MKNTLLLIGLCFIFTSSYSHTKGIPDEPEQLTERMYSFFTKTLKENYMAQSDSELYEKFLTDYFNEWNARDSSASLNIKLKIDKEELAKINKDLFRRDSLHYYYFYSEVIELSSDEDLEKAEKLRNLYPDIPFVIIQKGKTAKNVHLPTINEVQGIYLTRIGRERGFLYDLMQREKNRKESREFISSINEMNELMGGVYFYYVSCMTQSASIVELKYLDVRELISVIFWKFLCIETGTAFHTPPKGPGLIEKNYQ